MILFAILVCMTTVVAQSSFAAFGGGAGDDGNDQNKNSKLSSAHGIDANPVFNEDDNTEDDEKIVGPTAAAAINPEVRSLAWWQRYPHLPYKCSLCFRHFRSSKALTCHMIKAIHSNRHSKRESKITSSRVLPPALYPSAAREKADQVTPAGRALYADMERNDRSGVGRGFRRINMLFDLNLPPPLEPTDNEDQAKGDHSINKKLGK